MAKWPFRTPQIRRLCAEVNVGSRGPGEPPSSIHHCFSLVGEQCYDHNDDDNIIPINNSQRYRLAELNKAGLTMNLLLLALQAN